MVHDVVHYCIPNMTANVARTASRALSDAVIGLLRPLGASGVETLVKTDPGFAAGLYLHQGKLVNAELARALGGKAEGVRP